MSEGSGPLWVKVFIPAKQKLHLRLLKANRWSEVWIRPSDIFCN